MRAVIKSRKHIVQLPFNAITTAQREVNVLALVVDRTLADLATEVAEGSIIKAVFVEMWLQNSANDGHSIVMLEKATSGATGPSVTNMADIDSYANKKNVFFIHEGLTSNDGVGNPIPVMNSWFKIPKSKQRFGLGDRLVLSISNPSSNNLNRCGKVIYKEYS